MTASAQPARRTLPAERPTKLTQAQHIRRAAELPAIIAELAELKRQREIMRLEHAARLENRK